MITALITLAVALALVFVPLGLAKIAAVPCMRRAAAHLGMTTGLYRIVGTLGAGTSTAHRSRAYRPSRRNGTADCDGGCPW